MLEIKNLSIKFGGVTALDDVSLHVEGGQFVGLMGPNGAGKTTVINCISRIYDATAGSINFDGHDLLKLSGDKISTLGITRTFQDLGFMNHLSNMLIVDYLRLGQFDQHDIKFLRDSLMTGEARRREREMKRRARNILDFFYEIRKKMEPPEVERGYPFLLGREGFPDLIDVEYRPLGILSFAWRRRLDLARALVSNPRLLLLDEPAQGLAPSEIANLGHTLKLIQEEFGIAALIVEHNVATLANISDRLVVMNLGKKIAEGQPDEVRAQPEVIRIYLGKSKAESKPDIQETASPNALASTGSRKSKDFLLEVKNIDLFYGAAQALFSVSLGFNRNEITTILGTNGSGKSSLLRVISGVEKPALGEIFFEGKSLPVGWPEVAAERGIKYVPQGHVIFPELTTLDNLKIASHAFERDGLTFKMGLEKVLYYFPALKDVLQLPAASLSGGQQQILAISQVLMGKPKILMLDEPSLGLSPLLVDSLFEVILKISKEEGCSVVIVEQNVNKALEVSDYIYMLSSGALVGEGSSSMLRQSDDTVKRHLGFR